MSDETEHHHHEHPHPIEIFVNRREVSLPEHHATGLEIKEKADVPATFKLFNPRGDEVGNDERIRLHERERFTAISGQDVS